jgi:hypothetical protein
MSKKYYYTDAIVALYMMKEFGVEFETKHQSEFNGKYFFRGLGRLWVDNIDISDDSVRICSLLYLENNDKTCVNNKLYVVEESEHIFEPKEGDKDENGLFFDGRHWTDGVSYAISSEQSKTSFRFGKQFFMPEVEND